MTQVMHASYRSFREQAGHYFIRTHTKPPEGPISSPAVWLGPAMRDRESQWHVRLDDREIAELETELTRLDRAGVALEAIDQSLLNLPLLASKARIWRRDLMQGRGFVVVSGLPVEAWGEAKSAIGFWAIGHLLGLPGAQNAQGELLGHVRDYGEQANSPNVRLYRTPANINFHCDAADVVGLLCLETAKKGGQSRIASSVAIWNALFEEDPAVANELFEKFALDRRGEHPLDQPGYLELQPSCYGEDGVLRTFYHSEYFRSAERLEEVGPLPPEKRRLLDRYDALAGSPEFHLDMWLERGDMQFISNHTIVHARTEYEDDSDPARKRHLLRLWLSLETKSS